MLQRHATPATLAGVDAARGFFAGCVDPITARDTLWVAHLDEEARCLRLAAYPLGAGASVLPTRAILSDAALLGSAGLLLAHREPVDGSASSALARAATRLLAAAAEACGLTLVDHLVYDGDRCTSLRRAGAL